MLTTEEDALIAAVEADPFDDAPSLIYADWLQEHSFDQKADYLRCVVRLAHPPESPDDLARCLELAREIDSVWRQRVAARFEILIEGNVAILLMAHLFTSVMNITWGEALKTWEAGKPIRLKTEVTREEGEDFVQSFGNDPLGEAGMTQEGRLRLSVRAMDGPALGMWPASK